MDIESKTWNFTTTGNKVHTFRDGVALCRKSIRATAPEAGMMDFCQVKQSFKSAMCTGCENAFNLAIELDEAHAEALLEDAEQVETVELCGAPVYDPFKGLAFCITRKGHSRLTEGAEHTGDYTGMDAAHAAALREDAEQAAPAAHPAAGTYYPAAPGATAAQNATTLVLQREIISACVYADGSYTVFAGVHVISKGQLDGTEGQLMVFFAAEALVWSAGIDEAMAAEAEAREQRLAAHRDETPAPGERTLEEIQTLVDALGGEYMAYVTGSRPRKVAHRSVLAVLGDVPTYRGKAVVKDIDGESEWQIRVEDVTGHAIARYVFMGH